LARRETSANGFMFCTLSIHIEHIASVTIHERGLVETEAIPLLSESGGELRMCSERPLKRLTDICTVHLFIGGFATSKI